MRLRPSLRLRFAYAFDHGVEVWLGFVGVVAAVDFFIDPEQYVRSPLGQALHPWDYGWNLLYAVAGVALLAGLFGLRPRYELAGLSLMASAVAINWLAVASVLGWAGLTSEIFYSALVVCLLGRAWRIVKAEGYARSIE